MVHSASQKRSIRFRDEELCEYHTGAVMDLIECRKEIWYQQSDMSTIKRKALMVSKEAQRYGVGSLLSNTYGSNSNETQDALNTWCRNANSRRGLERWINDEYSAKRSDIRRRTIQSVLRAQQKMREESINDVGYGMKVISRLSEAFSQDSRNFARAMGAADELAANAEPDVSTSKDVALGLPPQRTSSPRSVIVARRPRSNLGLRSGVAGATDFRNFV
ncbi:hypothetical protein MPSEU_000856700 [Mayamaea pseudoterrestris]|nr:hypothetical protein MPSEU_000856700 [Mayamaea pseudoterrestris]